MNLPTLEVLQETRDATPSFLPPAIRAAYGDDLTRRGALKARRAGNQ